MNDEQIFEFFQERWKIGDFMGHASQSESVTLDDLRAFARLVRNEALEEAAKKVTSTFFGLDLIASTIRAMKEEA